MKEIITGNPSTITLSDLKKQAYPLIGVQLPDSKSVLQPIKYKSEFYKASIMRAWEMGNIHFCNGKENATIPEWVKFFNDMKDTKCFCFETTSELFKWLAE